MIQPPDGSRPVPLYRQVEAMLRHAVESGRFAPGQPLPNERTLASQYGVSRVTLRQALHLLCEQGVLRRIPGQGVLVPDAAQSPESNGKYVCVVTAGPLARFDTFYAAAMAQAEVSVRNAGLRAWFRLVPDMGDLDRVIGEVDGDPAVVGGLLMGRIRPEQVAHLVAQARTPWVKVGDFLEAERSVPVMDYATYDNYLIGHWATRALLQAGGSCFAMFALDECKIVSRDQVSAFRTQLDVAGVSGADQQIFDLATAEMVARDIDAYKFDAHVKGRIHRAFDFWEQSGQWPDGIIVPGGVSEAFQHSLNARPEVRERIDRARLVIWEYEERRRMSVRQLAHPAVTWVMTALEPVMARGVERLREPWPRARPFTCDFVRRLWFDGVDADKLSAAMPVSGVATPGEV